ncbi:alpha-amylase family protein [Microbulbifer thermotolerans]|uniref:alpha-amylase family glycosyl hydrolase n=1 Tax=Microbulbifer thermotolerans TaxID=252514 RepID=UPI00224ADED2|nr:alpha-amylase family glycosyl hydrolase [Microbulbifer thermotolerans]MCX2780626.1 alpha-amylase family protein [Microbulbifer thermotolerans]MCX2783703.1 alpha-amylase family protein [Microbulbifer thermotolerans]MCX2806167.1 alpha-amylase family protein [Microbulbifer thermotolerans]WKT60086.1 alpha-amylase family glycosyl hydrolase [Microbulbifer thermotolerans]
MKKIQSLFTAALLATAAGCADDASNSAERKPESLAEEKPVIYQVMTRLYGNTNPTNKPWGTLEENGVGKFNDFTPEVLGEIRDLGANYIWYTGALHHALVGDYTEYGIGNDDPDVVKGRAGSPYAIKDYYSVNPDLAENPAQRLDEFRALIERSHEQGLKVIIDIVPNHVARAYHSVQKPEGVRDFGADDDTSVTYARNNNFYYVIGEDFKVPESDDYKPLNGEPHPLVDGKFHESPAKWTGNGARAAQPDINDWYETVKINFGVRPDGSKDFPELSAEFAQKDYKAHAEFWADKDVPDTWKKFRNIADYWLSFGVDGFRYDMAGMVPVEFWSYLNSSIKMKKPDALLLAEIYTPERYRDYIHLGKMDYLYDKVGTYDTLRAIMAGNESTDALVPLQQGLADIAPHMLHFMENHDEQRIASGAFAGNAEAGKPAMLVSATISAAPTLVYFGQELGEAAAEDAGFGKASRTTIFDYWSVPSVRRWLLGESTEQEKQLRDFYKRLMNFSAASPALRGNYLEIHSYNREHNRDYDGQLFAFARWTEGEKLLVVANFGKESKDVTLRLPETLLQQWRLRDGTYRLTDQLSTAESTLVISREETKIPLQIAPLSGYILRLNL